MVAHMLGPILLRIWHVGQVTPGVSSKMLYRNFCPNATRTIVPRARAAPARAGMPQAAQGPAPAPLGIRPKTPLTGIVPDFPDAVRFGQCESVQYSPGKPF